MVHIIIKIGKSVLKNIYRQSNLLSEGKPLVSMSFIYLNICILVNIDKIYKWLAYITASLFSLGYFVYISLDDAITRSLVVIKIYDL